LRFIDDEKNVLQAATADVGQRGDLQLAVFQHILDFFVARLILIETVADHTQVIEKRLHIGIQLGLDIARQIAQILIGKRNHRTRQIDLAVALLHLQSGCQCQQGLAGPCLAAHGDQIDLQIHQSVQRKICSALRGKMPYA
jgi:hypothetical protein